MEKILNKLYEEKEIVEELIKIDNDVMNSNDTFDSYCELIECLLIDNPSRTIIDKDTVFVTDGDFYVTFDLLRKMAVAANVVIFINQGYVGMNKWLLSKYCELYGDRCTKLDTSINYNNYIDKGYRVIPIGEASFVDQVLEDFYGE